MITPRKLKSDTGFPPPGKLVVNAGFPDPRFASTEALVSSIRIRGLSARIYHVAVDGHGLDVSQIERLCKSRKIEMIYAIPHHHLPTSVTLASERRIRLLELAARCRFTIVEDDHDYEFHYSGSSLMPMASLDRNDNVIYVGTLSKSLARAIRVGFMAAPAPFIESATRLRKTIDRQGDNLVENAIAELYRDGTIDQHMCRKGGCQCGRDL